MPALRHSMRRTTVQKVTRPIPSRLSFDTSIAKLSSGRDLPSCATLNDMQAKIYKLAHHRRV